MEISKELKQIESLAEDILQEYTNCYSEVDKEVLAKMIYNAGYRKQSVGEWLPTCDNHPLVNKYKCSCCGNESMRGNFCPNCGAFMKGGAE